MYSPCILIATTYLVASSYQSLLIYNIHIPFFSKFKGVYNAVARDIGSSKQPSKSGVGDHTAGFDISSLHLWNCAMV